MKLVFQPAKRKHKNYEKTLRRALHLFNYTIHEQHLKLSDDINNVLAFDTDTLKLNVLLSSQLDIETKWFVDVKKWINAIRTHQDEQSINMITMNVDELNKLKSIYHNENI